MRVAAVQMIVSRELEDNLPRALEWVKRAGADGADFILLPECALSGYHGDIDAMALQGALVQVAATCAEAGVCGLVGTSYREGQSVYNQVRIYDNEGTFLGAHSKTIPTVGDLEWCVAGGGLQVFGHKGVRFGCLICNDLWCTPPAPFADAHLVQQLARGGAKVVFHAINSGFDQRYVKWHTAHLEMYADIHKVWIVTANAAGEEPVNAPTGVLAPERGWVTQAPVVGEQYLVCEVEV